MNRYAWRASIATVSLAALAMTGWSLFVVAHDTYGVPELFAYGAVAVYDGAAIACMYLASEAVRDGRAAIGAVLGTLLMAGVSVYLNTTHARLLDGTMPTVPAAVLFSSPTLALLLPSGLAWSAARYRARIARGESPFRLPAFGGWVWLLAPTKAGSKVRERALAHIEQAGATPPQHAATSGGHRASEVLRRRFAEMDPAEAIRIGHESQPSLPPAELAALLVGYGVVVDAVQVALVLHGEPANTTVEREPQQGATPVADQVTSPARPAITKAGAILDVADALGPDTKSQAIADEVARRHQVDVTAGTVRTVLSRAKKHNALRPQRDATQIGRGGEGYN